MGESDLTISEAFESMGVKLPKAEETTEEINNTDEYDFRYRYNRLRRH
jgi:hypothetical protein